MPNRVLNEGPSDARVMVVGEAPGADEDRQGHPFVGAAGTLLREELAKVGIPPDKVFYANLCQERPPRNELRHSFNDKGLPNDKVIEGLTALRADIERINPNLIIPLGAYALKFLTGKGKWNRKGDEQGYTGIGTYRGSILEGMDFCGRRKCLPSYHPAAVLRNYPWKHILRADLQRAAEQQAFPEIRRPQQATIIEPLGSHRDDWASWLVSEPGTPSPEFRWTDDRGAPISDESTRLSSDPFLSGDIEYIGSKLLCLGVTRHADISIVFPTRGAADVSYIRDILLHGVPLCFQNAMFDCSILEYHYEIACLQYLLHDTMIAMHAAYTEFPKDLGFIASIFTEQPVWYDHVTEGFWKEVSKALGGRVPLAVYEAVYHPYNAIDVRVTHRAMQSMLADELTDPDVGRTYRHEMALIRPLWEIGKRGVLMDVDKIARLKKQLEEEIGVLEAGLALLNAGKPWNVKSGQQKAEFLYETLAIPFRGGQTPKGQWKMDDTTLANIQLKVTDPKHKAAIKMIRDCTERRDRISKFCEIDLDDDGRMRCHYDPAKTVTGRLASRKFYPTGRGTNLQNQDRDVSVRSCFIADKGHVFGYADLKSAESLVVAHITGDPEMLKLHTPEFLSGKLDGHVRVASLLLDKPEDKITKDERYLGKRVRHAGNYEMSWFKLMQLINADAQKTGVSVDAKKAKRLIEKYRQLHIMLPAWWDEVLHQLRTTHTLYTLHRRKRVFYDRPENILPEAVAYNPQGTVGQTLNMGLLRLDPNYGRELAGNWMYEWDIEHLGVRRASVLAALSRCVNQRGFRMLLQIHDAIGFVVPEEHVESVLPSVRELMLIPIPIARKGVEPYEIVIPVEIAVGQNWGEYDEKKNPDGLQVWMQAA